MQTLNVKYGFKNPFDLDKENEKNDCSLNLKDFFKLSFENQGSPLKNLHHLFLQITTSPQYEEFILHLREIPTRNHSTTSMQLMINKDRQHQRLFIKIINENEDIFISGDIQKINSQFSQSKLNIVDSNAHISGTLMMKIWDHLCLLLKPKVVEVEDLAILHCKHCTNHKIKFSIKLWRIFSDRVGDGNKLMSSWYENFGYEIKNISLQYLQKIIFLSKLTFGTIDEIFEKSQMHEEQKLLRKWQAFTLDMKEINELNPSIPFSALFRRLENCSNQKKMGFKAHKIYHKILNMFFLELSTQECDSSNPKNFSELKSWINEVDTTYNILIKNLII